MFKMTLVSKNLKIIIFCVIFHTLVAQNSSPKISMQRREPPSSFRLANLQDMAKNMWIYLTNKTPNNRNQSYRRMSKGTPRAVLLPVTAPSWKVRAPKRRKNVKKIYRKKKIKPNKPTRKSLDEQDWLPKNEYENLRSYALIDYSNPTRAKLVFNNPSYSGTDNEIQKPIVKKPDRASQSSKLRSIRLKPLKRHTKQLPLPSKFTSIPHESIITNNKNFDSSISNEVRKREPNNYITMSQSDDSSSSYEITTGPSKPKQYYQVFYTKPVHFNNAHPPGLTAHKFFRPVKKLSRQLMGRDMKPSPAVQKKMNNMMKTIYPYYHRPKYRYPYYDKNGKGKLVYGFGNNYVHEYNLFQPLQGYSK